MSNIIVHHQKNLNGHRPHIPLSLVSRYDKVSAEDHCRMCLRSSQVRPLTRHHLVPVRWWRTQTGRWMQFRNLPANVVPLCRQCHDLVERELESRRMLRRSLVQDEIAFVIAVRSQEWLDHRYPK